MSRINSYTNSIYYLSLGNFTLHSTKIGEIPFVIITMLFSIL